MSKSKLDSNKIIIDVKRNNYKRNNKIFDRTIISSPYNYIGFLEKEVRFEFHIVGVFENEDIYEDDRAENFDLENENGKRLTEDYSGLKEMGLSKINHKEELATFCPNFNNNAFYFYKKIFDENQRELPIFYNLFCIHEFVDDHHAVFKFKDAINLRLNDLVITQKLSNQYHDILSKFEKETVYNIYFILEAVKNKKSSFEEINLNEEIEELEFVEDYMLYPFIENMFKEIKSYYEEANDYAVKTYIKSIQDSLYLYLKDKKIALSCPNCDKIFPYLKGKKFCCKKCLKKVANDRYYSKKKKSLTKKSKNNKQTKDSLKKA